MGDESATAHASGVKLRVATVVERYLELEQTFIFRQMNGLSSCEILFLARHKVEEHPYPEDNVQFFGCGQGGNHVSVALDRELTRVRRRLQRAYVLLLWREEMRLRHLLQSFSPHIVHAHWGPEAMMVSPTCQRLRLPLLVHFHGYDASRLIAEPVYVDNLRGLFSRMQLALTVSENMRQRILSLGCPPEKILTHYTGVPEAYFLDAPRVRRGKLFLMLQVGRLEPGKGHQHALRVLAAAIRRTPQLRLRIVGEGKLEQEIRRQIEALGISGHVELAGRLNPATVVTEMRQADALVMPTHSPPDGGIEGLPNVVVEAMANRLPVVATRHGGIPEAVCYSERDWLVAEGDVEGLKVRIERLASDNDLWLRLSNEGYELARSGFHLPTQNRRLEALYRALLPHR